MSNSNSSSGASDSSSEAHQPETLVSARQVDPCVLVLFGVTGDLSCRKLIPALYHLERTDSLPAEFAVVGYARRAGNDEELRAYLKKACGPHIDDRETATWDRLARRIHATAGLFDDADGLHRLQQKTTEVGRQFGTAGNRMCYFAAPARFFAGLLDLSFQAGLIERNDQPTGWSRVIIEKPFGNNLATAQTLNQEVRRCLHESQVYRIDHYLGKEAVQNLLVFRFGNSLFEPLWNRRHVDSVQITASESIGVEGRGAFYEETGVLRDILQNHLLQVLSLCAMEPPVSFEADEVRNMKSQVLRSLRPVLAHEIDRSIFLGQYQGYRQEAGVAEESRTPTFVAMRLHLDNWRWQGIPFYVRAGKCLASRYTEVAIKYRQIPACLFGTEDVCRLVAPNVLRIRIQPDSGISLSTNTKVPGEDLTIAHVPMNFRTAEAFDARAPDAYERLLLDCMRGDPTLFARRDEVELSWQFVDPIQQAWDQGRGTLHSYAGGSTGPQEAVRMPFASGDSWEQSP